MVDDKVLVTDANHERLQAMLVGLPSLGNAFRARMRELGEELTHADLVEAASVDRDVVTMNSLLRTRDLNTGRTETFTLVYHGDSDMFARRVSVLTTLGMAVLGRRVGDVIEQPVRQGTRRMMIEELLYQPESAGDREHLEEGAKQ